MQIEQRPKDSVPMFSVCVPQFNRTPFLMESIRSFVGQRFNDIELCISDGNSTDGRQKELVLALELSGLAFVYRRSSVNLRYDQNLRTAIGLARGRYCMLMGNDDAMNGERALEILSTDMEAFGPVGVVISDFCDFRTGQKAYRIRRSDRYDAGPEVAARHFRNFSFVSGIVIERAAAQALATDRWDGSEMYQTYIGCRMIAGGHRLLERATALVRKDIVVPDEQADSYARAPKVWPCPIVERPLPLCRLGRLVADAIAPYVGRDLRTKMNETILLQLLGITYPYWLFEHRRVQSWRYSAGVALAMRPSRVAEGIQLGIFRTARVAATYVAATAVGLLTPSLLFQKMKGLLYIFAKSVGMRGDQCRS